MTNEEILVLINTVLGRSITADCVESTDIRDYDPEVYEGMTEIGYRKEVSEGHFILCNERCDSITKYIEHPTVLAVGLAHYHRRGFKYGLTVYTR